MVAKLSLLDSTQLDAMENRFGNINSRLEQILSNLNSAAQDTEKEKKVCDSVCLKIYETLDI